MGLGLSVQQKNILRAALSVNAEINQGVPLCRASMVDCEPGEFNVLHHTAPPDTMPEMVYVLVLGLDYHGYNTIDGRPGGLYKHDAPTIVTAAQKVSVHKALHRLVERGLLLQYWVRISNPCSISGFLLTQDGIDKAASLPPFDHPIAQAVEVFRKVDDVAQVVVDWRETHKNETFCLVQPA